MNVEKAINKKSLKTTSPIPSTVGEQCISPLNSHSLKSPSVSRVPISQPINALKEEPLSTMQHLVPISLI
jgi:hypothetical protein